MIDFVVIEDERLFAELLVAVLEGPDLHCVGTARTADEATSLLQRTRPGLALVDVNLADGQDGLAVAAALRAINPDLRLVVLTSMLVPSVLHRTAALDADALFSKDIDLGQLRDALVHPQDGFVVDPLLLRRLVAHETPPVTLTARELEVLRGFADGHDVRAIARDLGISPHTVRGYAKSLLAKLGAHSQLEAVALAGRLGILGSR